MKYFDQNLHLWNRVQLCQLKAQSDLVKTISNPGSPEGDGVSGLQSHVVLVPVCYQLIRPYVGNTDLRTDTLT